MKDYSQLTTKIQEKKTQLFSSTDTFIIFYSKV